MRSFLLSVPIICLTAGSTYAQTATRARQASSSSINNPIAFALAPPKASCQAHPTGQSVPSGQVVADDLGVARFHVTVRIPLIIDRFSAPIPADFDKK